MGFFNGNYSKPGPGVSKNERKRKGLGRFYQIFFRKFWSLVQLNILYIVTLLPTFAVVFILSGMLSNKLGLDMDNFKLLSGGTMTDVTAAMSSITMDLLIRFYISALFAVLWGGGPATAGFVFILRSFLREEPVFLVSDYFRHVFSNFKQAIAVWIIDVLVFCLFCYAYFFYGFMGGIMVCMKYVVLVLAFFYTILHLYLYHLLITYKLTIVKLYKNSALFAISALPFSTVTVAVCGFVVLIWPAIGFTAQNEKMSMFFIIAIFVLLFALIFSACGLYIENSAETQIKKYIKEDADIERNE